ncbi:MAG TPA: alpha/beta hydrolase fold domain-containing protein [Vicinamibacterales bacterium]
MLRAALWIVLALSVMLLFLSAWILIPSPNDFLFPLAVGSPEVAPVLLAGGILLLVLSARYARHRRVARLALLCAAFASLLSLVPIAQLPIALARFNRAMAQTTAEPPARAPGAIRVTRGVPFSKADGVPLSLDVYQPAANGPFPIVMQIYGGSWQSGSPLNQEWFSRHFAERGYVVVAIDYRHAPEWKWPEQIVDVRTALYWISEDARKFGGDPSRIVLVGRSAGAQLAMRLAYQEGPSSVRGVVNYYGPADLAEGWRHPPRPDPADVRGILEAFIGGTPAQKPEHYRHASPITWVSKASAPTLSIYGRRDHIVEARFGRMLDTALKTAGATSVLLELPWSEHSFDAVPNGMGRRIALHYTERFIAWAVNR